MHNTRMPVCGFKTAGETGVIAVELYSPLHKLRESCGAFSTQRLNSISPAQTRTGGKRVGNVLLNAVAVCLAIGIGDHGHSTLCPRGITLFKLALRDERDLCPREQLPDSARCIEASEATADYRNALCHGVCESGVGC
jgi:hypothetical protein